MHVTALQPSNGVTASQAENAGSIPVARSQRRCRSAAAAARRPVVVGALAVRRATCVPHAPGCRVHLVVAEGEPRRPVVAALGEASVKCPRAATRPAALKPRRAGLVVSGVSTDSAMIGAFARTRMSRVPWNLGGGPVMFRLLRSHLGRRVSQFGRCDRRGPGGGLLEAQVLIRPDWRTEYNTYRSHSALGMLTPAEFADHWRRTNPPQLS